MEYLGWTLTDPSKLEKPGDIIVYALNKNGEGLTADTIDEAMKAIRIKIERSTEVVIELDEEE